MKKTISGIFILATLLFVCTSGLIEPLARFFVWLVSLNLTQSPVSSAGEVFVKIATFLISYISIGLIFHAIGCFDSDIMKIAYFIVSTLVSFALCWLVMVLETHLLLISIVAGVLLLLVLTTLVILNIRSKKTE